MVISPRTLSALCASIFFQLNPIQPLELPFSSSATAFPERYGRITERPLFPLDRAWGLMREIVKHRGDFAYREQTRCEPVEIFGRHKHNIRRHSVN